MENFSRIEITGRDKFKVESIGPGYWRIRDGQVEGVWTVDCYLVEGTERALLVDAGISGRELAGTVRRLTDKPVTLVLLHTHSDHTAAAGQFNDVYVSYLEHTTTFMEDGFTEKINSFKNLTDGMVFDLGARSLEAIHVPGHTQGSFVLLCAQDHVLLTSDTIGSGPIWMQLPESSLSAAFVPWLMRLEEGVRGMPDLKLLVGHSHQSRTQLTAQYITDVRIAAERVASGERGEASDAAMGPFGARMLAQGQMQCYVFKEPPEKAVPSA